MSKAPFPIVPNSKSFFVAHMGDMADSLVFSPYAIHRRSSSSWSHDSDFPVHVLADEADAEKRWLIACAARCEWLDLEVNLADAGYDAWRAERRYLAGDVTFEVWQHEQAEACKLWGEGAK